MGSMTISEMQNEAFETAKSKGFHDVDRELDVITRTLRRLALITSEVGEAVEAARKDDMDNLGEELADIVIRVGDLAGVLDISLSNKIQMKMMVNKNRPHLHGKLA